MQLRWDWAVCLVLLLILPVLGQPVRDRPVEPLALGKNVEKFDLPVPSAFKGGAMVKLRDGRILLLASSSDVSAPNGEAQLWGFISADGGVTWNQPKILLQSPEYNIGRPTLLRTREGKIWLFYYGLARHTVDGNQKTQSNLYVTSSLDDGVVWEAPRLLFEGYTAGQRSAIQTQNGDIVVAFSYAADKTGRNASTSFVSRDDGKNWLQGSVVELPGKSSHSGALEPAVVELNDGRLWLLIRHGTYFRQSFSEDGGLTWSPPTETTITQPSPLGGAPASIIRLGSGRLAMAWNPHSNVPQTASDWALHGRWELAVALSDDDGKTWSKPHVCARAASVTYPHLLEATPGHLLLTTGLLRATDPITGQRIRTDTVVFRLTEADVLRGDLQKQ